MRKNLSLLFLTVLALSLGACSGDIPSEASQNNTTSNGAMDVSSNIEASSIDEVSSNVTDTSEVTPDITYLTVSEAVALANEVGEEGTARKQYVTGTVKNISNPNYGEMYITDGTSELYIYGVYSADGVKRYPELEEKPYSGDEVFLYGYVKTYKGNPEMGASWLQKMISHQGEEDLTGYTNSSILAARNAAKGSKVKIKGAVAKINHANGMIPNGFYLVDSTSSIYVYSKEIAGRVVEGEEIEIAGTRDDYILDSEANLAQKVGYKGAIQITDAIYIKSTGKNKQFDKSWISNSTVKEMMDTPLTNNITSKIFKVNAIINKAPGQGFTNYYINDLDNKTGSYVYSMCNGSDFGYLDVFDGKICTVYLAIHNAKSTNSGAVYRLMPISVEENKNFSMSDEEIINFALNYYAKTQFLDVYNSDPALEVLTSASNEYIPFNNVALSYESGNPSIINFANESGKTIMHINEGNATINVTLKGSYNGKNASIVTQIQVLVVNIPDVKTVAQAIAAEDGEIVTVRGVVMSSVIVQTAFYINDGTGVIAVRTDSATIANIKPGNEIAVQGTRKHVKKDGSSNVGQSCIDDATLLANFNGNHQYDESTFVTDMSIDDILKYSGDQATVDRSTTVFVAECKLTVVATNYYTNYYLSNADNSSKFLLYASSGATQYGAFNVFVDKTITATFMLCDWNSKGYYAACLVSATDGETTVVNTYNFK